MPILNGWKQIANHIGQGIRTVQRWEVLGLPVHRPKSAPHGTVIAFTEEIDIWSHATPLRYADEIERLKAEVVDLKSEVESLKVMISDLLPKI